MICFLGLSTDLGTSPLRAFILYAYFSKNVFFMTILTGMAASPGTHTGRAVIAETPDIILSDPRDVLVFKSSSMDWFIALTRVGAVVTETGGRTSHAATICRELGKPCVTAVLNATSVISPGAWVTVNGETGTVTILS
jgi:phosphoenolpyruvate synthase/pyruvate phosphate dikinase